MVRVSQGDKANKHYKNQPSWTQVPLHNSDIVEQEVSWADTLNMNLF